MKDKEISDYISSLVKRNKTLGYIIRHVKQKYPEKTKQRRLYLINKQLKLSANDSQLKIIQLKIPFKY